MTTTRAELDGSSFTSVSVASATASSIVVEPAETNAGLTPIRPWLSLHGETLLLVVVDAAAVARLTLFVHGGRLELLVAGLALLFCSMSSLYRFRPQLSLLDDLPRLVTRVMAAVAAVVTGKALAGSEVNIRSVLMVGVQLLAVLALTRIVTYSVIRHGRRVRCFAQPTLIVAEGRDGSRLVSMFRDHPEYGLVPVGIVAADPASADSSGPVPVLGGMASLCAALEQGTARQVVAQCGVGNEGALREVVRSCALAHTELMFVPRQHEFTVDATNGTHAWGQPLMPLRRGAFLSPTWPLKRLLDIALSGVALLILGPLLVACAIAVLIESGRPILFRQERVGANGNVFELLKFRSMRPVSSAEADVEWTPSDVSRVGRVGRWLRRSSLDELPQLWNVVAGHMSLVGPRPERPHFVDEFSLLYDNYQYRHRVPVGITGLAQIHGLRGDTSIEDRVRFDNYYIEAWSLWGDLKILLRTAIAVFTRPGS